MIAGDKIKNERTKRKLSQEDLGKLIGVTKVSICGYETGTRTPTIGNLLKLSKVLELNPNEIIGGTVFAVSEEGTPYEFVMSEKEITAVQEIRKYDILHDMICNQPEKTIKRIVELIKE